STVTHNAYAIDTDTRYVFPASETQWFLNDFKYGIGHSLTVEETLRVDVTKSLSMLLGGVYSTYDVIPKSTIPGGVDLGRPITEQGGSFVFFTEKGNPDSKQEIPRVVKVDYFSYGGYAEGGWQVTDKLKAIGGVRVDKDSRIDQP